MTAPDTVVLQVRLGRRERTALGGLDPERPDPVARVPRVARVLALAHHWRGLIRDGVARDQADLARLVGVSRARVTQVMGLLYLAPDIQEEILLHDRRQHLGDVRHRDLLRIAAEAAWSEQRRIWGPTQTG